MKISLKERQIPRNEKGDPCFKSLLQLRLVFSEEEITELCNRALYQMEYQNEAHLKRSREATERLREVKAAVRSMYGVPWSKATEEQVREAWKRVREKERE